MAEERQENSLYKVGDEVLIRATVVTVDDGLDPSLKYEVAFTPTQKIWVPQSADIRLYNRVAGNEEALIKITTINSNNGHVILDGIEYEIKEIGGDGTKILFEVKK